MFQGNPVNNLALKISIKAKLPENKITERKFLDKKGPTNKLPTPKKIPKKIGNPIIETVIKNLKDSSKVKEWDIQ